jgi:hypothetical protein
MAGKTNWRYVGGVAAGVVVGGIIVGIAELILGATIGVFSPGKHMRHGFAIGSGG